MAGWRWAGAGSGCGVAGSCGPRSACSPTAESPGPWPPWSTSRGRPPMASRGRRPFPPTGTARRWWGPSLRWPPISSSRCRRPPLPPATVAEPAGAGGRDGLVSPGRLCVWRPTVGAEVRATAPPDARVAPTSPPPPAPARARATPSSRSARRPRGGAESRSRCAPPSSKLRRRSPAGTRRWAG